MSKMARLDGTMTRSGYSRDVHGGPIDPSPRTGQTGNTEKVAMAPDAEQLDNATINADIS